MRAPNCPEGGRSATGAARRVRRRLGCEPRTAEKRAIAELTPRRSKQLKEGGINAAPIKKDAWPPGRSSSTSTRVANATVTNPGASALHVKPVTGNRHAPRVNIQLINEPLQSEVRGAMNG
jgi:hypothetical protein